MTTNQLMSVYRIVDKCPACWSVLSVIRFLRACTLGWNHSVGTIIPKLDRNAKKHVMLAAIYRHRANQRKAGDVRCACPNCSHYGGLCLSTLNK